MKRISETELKQGNKRKLPNKFENGRESTQPPPESSRSMLVDLLAGGISGSTAVVLTCPLDVIQTRLQSSAFRMQRITGPMMNLASCHGATRPAYFVGLVSYGKFMAKSEGVRSLFKGLCPTLMAVTPSRAIYFTTYKKTKDFLNSKAGVLFAPDSTPVYLLSGATAQFINSTATNPLWFLKTRLQLNFSQGREVSLLQTIRSAYQENGLRTFYRGLNASYLGMTEVALHFAIYEHLKQALLEVQGKSKDHHSFNFIECILAAGIAKVVSMGTCYPYEVIRTRLRQQESNVLGQRCYKTIAQTLRTVLQEEKLSGLYGGAATALIRQVPFITIMFCTYEGVIYLTERHNILQQPALP